MQGKMSRLREWFYEHKWMLILGFKLQLGWGIDRGCFRAESSTAEGWFSLQSPGQLHPWIPPDLLIRGCRPRMVRIWFSFRFCSG